MRRPQHDLEYWDIASKYWKDIATVNPYWAWNTFFSKVIPDEHLDILVLGVTNGAFLHLLKTFRPKSWVCGIDLSFRMIRNVQEVEEKLVCCRGNSLPFKEGKFDIVLSDYFLSIIGEDTLRETIKEVERVLRPKGIFIGKELRHRGHVALWAAFTAATGLSSVGAAFFSPLLSLVLFILCVLALLVYNPVTRKMGKSSALAKLALHILKFMMKKKRIPTLKEISELYFLSRKYLHIFSDREMGQAFAGSSLQVDAEAAPLSWSFSVVGVKKTGKEGPEKSKIGETGLTAH